MSSLSAALGVGGGYQARWSSLLNKRFLRYSVQSCSITTTNKSRLTTTLSSIYGRGPPPPLSPTRGNSVDPYARQTWTGSRGQGGYGYAHNGGSYDTPASHAGSMLYHEDPRLNMTAPADIHTHIVAAQSHSHSQLALSTSKSLANSAKLDTAAAVNGPSNGDELWSEYYGIDPHLRQRVREKILLKLSPGFDLRQPFEELVGEVEFSSHSEQEIRVRALFCIHTCSRTDMSLIRTGKMVPSGSWHHRSSLAPPGIQT